mmetsp:Transcript_18733/g.16002  ORF Transcript_18733/g.16002 Transcript_18733/m.16002 type:complete len:81 (-) Transcript_18733:338-580(-)
MNTPALVQAFYLLRGGGGTIENATGLLNGYLVMNAHKRRQTNGSGNEASFIVGNFLIELCSSAISEERTHRQRRLKWYHC